MTVVSSVAATLYVFTGPGVYTFTFPALEAYHIKCTLMKTGEESIFLAYQTGYTVTLAPTGNGGAVTIPDPGYYIDWTDWSLEVRRVMPLTQEIDWVNNGPFSLPLIEYSIDKLTLMIQQIQVQMESGWIYPLPTAASLQQLLTDIKQIDGHNSGIDADMLDGLHSSEFLTLDGVVNAGFVTDTYLQAQGYANTAEIDARITPAKVLERLNASMTLGNLTLNSNGWVHAFAGPSSQENRDFVLMDAGKLTFQRYRDGAYKEYMGVKRVEYGQATSGATVEIPGWWDSIPRLIISPFSIKSYDTLYKEQSQKWTCRADNLKLITGQTNRYQFDAVAELSLFASSGNSVYTDAATQSGNTWTSPQRAIVPNTVSMTVNVSSLSVRGNGTSTYGYYYRQVVAKVQFYRTSLVGWVDGPSKTLTIGSSTTTTKSDFIACTGLTNDYTHVRVAYTASDVSGGFTIPPHSDYWDYKEDIRSGGSEVSINGTASGSYALGSFVPVAGYSIWKVVYSYKILAYGLGWYPSYRCIAIFPDGASYNTDLLNGYWYVTSVANTWFACNDYTTAEYISRSFTITSGAYTPSLSFSITAGGDGSEMRVKDGGATIYTKKLTVNSATPSNTFTMVSVDWNTGDVAATLSLGSLNWMAVGD